MTLYSGNYFYPIKPINKGVDVMQCKHCGCIMVPISELYRFDGNSDIMWSCSDIECLTSCNEEIRFSQTYKEKWQHFDGVKNHEWINKKKINVKRGGRKR